MWTKTVVEWLERIADQSKRLENDPACGCMPEPKVGSNGLVNLMLDRISMLVPFERGRGHIDFPTLGLSVRAKDIQQLFRKTYSIPRRHVPRYLLFLADADATIFQGRFRPYVPQRLEVEGSAPRASFRFLQDSVSVSFSVSSSGNQRSSGTLGRKREQLLTTGCSKLETFYGSKSTFAPPRNAVRAGSLLGAKAVGICEEEMTVNAPSM